MIAPPLNSSKRGVVEQERKNRRVLGQKTTTISKEGQKRGEGGLSRERGPPFDQKELKGEGVRVLLFTRIDTTI